MNIGHLYGRTGLWADIIARRPQQVWGDLSYFSELLSDGPSRPLAAAALRRLAEHGAARRTWSTARTGSWLGRKKERTSTPRGSPQRPRRRTVPAEDFAWRSAARFLGLEPGQRFDLRRHLEQWAKIGVLAQVHAVLVGMLRGDPDLILDTCSVRAKRGGDLTGPNPTDRGKRGTKYHVATTGDGVPVACAATAANVNDTLVFERLFLAAFAVMARIRTVFADKGYDAEHHRDLCRQFGAEPRIHKRGQPHGSGLGKRRWPVERSNAWVLENKRLALRYDRLGFIIQSLLQAACIFLVAGRLASEL